MLVLSRFLNEEIVITVQNCPQIRVTVVDIRKDPVNGTKVRLGFTAPKDVVIDRKEIDDLKESQKHTHALHPDHGGEG